MKEVLDDRVEAVGIGRDVRDHGCAYGVVKLRATRLEQARVAIDRGHGRPELVRHEAQERVLDRVRGLQRLGRGGDGSFGIVPLGHVDQHVDRAHQPVVVVEQRRRVGHERDLAAIGSDGDRLAAADRPGLLERDRHRTFVMAHRGLVGPQQLQRPAPFLAECRPPAPEVRRGRIEERDPAVRVRRVHGHAEGVEEAPVAIDLPLRGSRRDRASRRRAARDDAQQMAVQGRGRTRPGVPERAGLASLDRHVVLCRQGRLEVYGRSRRGATPWGTMQRNRKARPIHRDALAAAPQPLLTMGTHAGQ